MYHNSSKMVLTKLFVINLLNLNAKRDIIYWTTVSYLHLVSDSVSKTMKIFQQIHCIVK